MTAESQKLIDEAAQNAVTHCANEFKGIATKLIRTEFMLTVETVLKHERREWEKSLPAPVPVPVPAPAPTPAPES
jgi:hypothetical protein